MIRLTNLGIRQVPGDVVEAARAYGASNFRVLTDVQLPLARAAIMTGVNQVLLLALSFVGIIAVIAGGGLGQLVLRGVNTRRPRSGCGIWFGAVFGGGGYGPVEPARPIRQPVVYPQGERGHARHLHRSSAAHRRTGRSCSRACGGIPSSTSPFAARNGDCWRYRPGWGALAILSAFFTWVDGAGRLSSYARPDDQALDDTFNGIEASGGSWFGILVLIIGVLVVLVSVLLLLRIRDRWSSSLDAASGLVFAGVAVIGMMVVYLSIAPHELADSSSHGIGVFLALASGVILLLGGLLSWRSSRSSPVPIRTAALPLRAGDIRGGFADHRLLLQLGQ